MLILMIMMKSGCKGHDSGLCCDEFPKLDEYVLEGARDIKE
jgi:hypothetical protein